mmetsp:Transcript_21595/g.31624  ORF Transcript_21595/g.31624 Transcript_21595/m.31624 type:complete len:94 (+) Transcript_21595:316-597(+)
MRNRRKKGCMEGWHLFHISWKQTLPVWRLVMNMLQMESISRAMGVVTMELLGFDIVIEFDDMCLTSEHPKYFILLDLFSSTTKNKTFSLTKLK